MESTIWARNILLGDCVFAKFKLPEGWAIRPTLYPPDVEEYTEHGGLKWAASGFIILDLYAGRDKPLRLEIKAKRSRRWLTRERAARSLGVSADSVREAVAGGHEAYYAVKESRRLLGGRRMEVKLVLYCHETQRTIRFTVEGAPEHVSSCLAEVLELLTSVTCH